MSVGSLVFCNCEAFRLWYAEDGIEVCHCGHPRGEHLDSVKVCLGESVVYPAQAGDGDEERAQAE